MIATPRFLRLRLPVFAAAAALCSAAALAQPVTPSARPFRSEPIPDRYIVVFKGGAGNPDDEATEAVRGAGGGRILHTYRAVRGFSATLSPAALRNMRNNPNVEYIEQDQTVSLSQSGLSATWGIDRIDQVDRPLDSIYHYNYSGAGVHAFIIDTGIRADHVEFAGRVLPGFTSVTDGNGTNDCNGHGTHVSGTVGGTTWGVAKQVTLTPVRVLNCQGSGTWSGVIAGIDWVANSTLRPAVANISLGGGLSTAVNSAVARAVAKGVTVVVAAGNDSANACNYSPARERSAITVGATTSGDARASYSNFGNCLDIFAPGSSITSSWHTASNASSTISGTSMASPHVTGVAALVAQANPGASPATIASYIVSTATPNHVASAGAGSPNLLLYSLGRAVAAPPVVQAVAVKTLAGSSSLQGPRNRARSWQAQATATVRDISSGAAVADATVTGSFSSGSTTGTCVTGSNGSCFISASGLSLTTTITVFTVTGISGTNMAYDAGANAAAQITVNRP